MTLRDEIAALANMDEPLSDIPALARAILELMDNRPAPVRIKLIRSATKDQNEGWEISADSNATSEECVSALTACLVTRSELIKGIDREGFTSLSENNG